LIDRIRRHPPGHAALLDPEGPELPYGGLLERVDAAAKRLGAVAAGPALAFLAMGLDSESVVLYLACLEARIPVCLCESEPAAFGRLAQAYEPEILLLPPALEPPPGCREEPSPSPRHRLWRRTSGGPRAVHPDLAVLLTTSGSTGSPKLVRLSARNLAANAGSIVRYLEIDAEERAIQSLPLQYSYGLSVLNSHLVAGGSVALTPHSFLRREFWSVVDERACTSFAGVPYMYETLHRLRLDPATHPTLRTLTQAGGGLAPDLTLQMLEVTERAGGRFFVMYGQTEATARISYVPPARLHRKIGAIGIPIPDGRLSLAPAEDAGEAMELVYEGPNVMMGYAESPADLALGDLQGGRLRTGDLGRVDEDGYFFLTGRLRRFAKLFGRRVGLEDVEREVEAEFPARVAATDGGDRMILHVEPTGTVDAAQIAGHVSRRLGVPPAAVVVRVLTTLPRTVAGKKDYRALEVGR